MQRLSFRYGTRHRYMYHPVSQATTLQKLLAINCDYSHVFTLVEASRFAGRKCQADAPLPKLTIMQIPDTAFFHHHTFIYWGNFVFALHCAAVQSALDSTMFALASLRFLLQPVASQCLKSEHVHVFIDQCC